MLKIYKTIIMVCIAFCNMTSYAQNYNETSDEKEITLIVSGDGVNFALESKNKPLLPYPKIVYRVDFKFGKLYILSLYFLYDLSFILESFPIVQQYELFLKAFDEVN